MTISLQKRNGERELSRIETRKGGWRRSMIHAVSAQLQKAVNAKTAKPDSSAYAHSRRFGNPPHQEISYCHSEERSSATNPEGIPLGEPDSNVHIRLIATCESPLVGQTFLFAHILSLRADRNVGTTCGSSCIVCHFDSVPTENRLRRRSA